MSKLRSTLLYATLLGLSGMGALYAQDVKQPDPSEDPSVTNPSTAPAAMPPLAADTDRANQSTRPNDHSTGGANQGTQDQPPSGANESTRPNDQSTGSTEHKRAQKNKNNNQPIEPSSQDGNSSSTGNKPTDSEPRR